MDVVLQSHLLVLVRIPKILLIMRHLVSILLVLCCIIGCDNVALEERWSNATPIVPKKNVLVLEYTGQRCVNCPSAAEQIASLQSGASGKHVIAVAVHGGHLAENGEQSALGLANSDSEWLTQQAGVQGWPMGSIDGGNLQLPPAWGASVAQQLAEEAKASLRLFAQYDSTTRQVQAEVTATALADCVLHVYLVEDSIPSLQYLPSGKREMNYMHRHVLRQILTPREGVAISLTQSQQPTWQTTFMLPKAYGLLGKSPELQAKYPQLLVLSHRLHLIAFVEHRLTHRVLEVKETPLTKSRLG